MNSDFSWKNLEDVTAEIIDRRGITPRKLGGDFSSTGHRVISAKLVKAGQLWLDIDEPRFVDSSIYKKWMKTCLQAGDVLMTSEAPLGEVAYLAEDYDWALGQRLFAIRPLPEVLNGRFLYYALQTSQVRADILGRASGTTVQGIRQAELRLVKIPIPSLPLQTKIAQILGALDDRITLLRETNKTLEAIAQAIFKSWFVDFDPVHSKAEGRAPEGMDDETAALFPDEFEKSELGLVPKGWEITPFASTVNIIGGGTPKTSIPEYWNGDIPWFSVVDAPEHSNVWVINTEKQISSHGLQNSSTKLLPPRTTIISARGTVGRLALTGRSMTMNQSCYALRGIADDSFFTYYSTRRLVNLLRQHAHGSVFSTITRATLAGISIAYPLNHEAIGAFEATVEPLMQRILSNVEQSNSLTAIRDTLLPRLISGKLRLPEAEAMVEEVI